MSKKMIMDAITRMNSSGDIIYLDFVPCPNEDYGDYVSKALDYYGCVYPGDYIDVVCNSKRK